MLFKKKLVVRRANQTSPLGREKGHLAFAVDAHKCFLFLCEETEDPREWKIVPVKLGDFENMEDLYEQFLEKQPLRPLV